MHKILGIVGALAGIVGLGAIIYAFAGPRFAEFDGDPVMLRLICQLIAFMSSSLAIAAGTLARAQIQKQMTAGHPPPEGPNWSNLAVALGFMSLFGAAILMFFG